MTQKNVRSKMTNRSRAPSLATVLKVEVGALFSSPPGALLDSKLEKMPQSLT